MAAGPVSAAAGAPPRPARGGNALGGGFLLRMSLICPATGSGTGILNVVGPSTALFHNPSPTGSILACSVNLAFGAIGALAGSWATRAARYVSAMPRRHARSHAPAVPVADDAR